MNRRFNLSLDDYSPRPNTNDLYWCNKLIEKYPDIKIDLFVPAAFCRLGEKPNYLSEHLEWVAEIKSNLSPNYNICLHGLYHRRSNKDYNWHKLPESNNDEFRYLNYSQAELLLNRIVEEFRKVGLNYQKVFRPPAWKISKEAAQLLIDMGFIIAGDKEYHDKLKDNIDRFKWISYNWDLLTQPPEGDIIAYGHTSNWTTNSMNEERYNTIINFLNGKEFKFCFMKEL